MLQSGDIRISEEDDKNRISPGRAARLLVQAEAAWGRNTYRLALGRLAKSSRRAAERDDLSPEKRAGLTERADDADALATWIGTLVRSVPAADSAGLVDLQKWPRPRAHSSPTTPRARAPSITLPPPRSPTPSSSSRRSELFAARSPKL
jgi:hypothetical protein